MHNYILSPTYISSFIIIESVVTVELPQQSNFSGFSKFQRGITPIIIRGSKFPVDIQN